MNVPGDVAVLLQGRPRPDSTSEQAFPFLTVDPHGFPHVALLSRAELDVRTGGGAVLAVIASVRTRANLGRDGRAGLIAIDGTVAHYLKLQVEEVLDEAGVSGYALDVVEHKRDTLGIPLNPIGFQPTGDIAVAERWDTSAQILRSLGAGTGS